MAERSARNTMILAAAEMAQTEAGRRWLDAMGPYVEEAREACVMAPKEHLDYAQGVARQGTVLLKLLKGSKEEAVKIIAAERIAADKTKEHKT